MQQIKKKLHTGEAGTTEITQYILHHTLRIFQVSISACARAREIIIVVLRSWICEVQEYIHMYEVQVVRDIRLCGTRTMNI